MVAIGGLSGTGKTTLARGLAPALGAAPGALVLRSDVVRKTLAGVAPEVRLGAEHYTNRMTERVYDALIAHSRNALDAGHSVIVDAVSGGAGHRADLEAVAAAAGVPFHGLWLEAPLAEMVRRVDGRAGDASDADGAIVRQQADLDFGPIGWARIEAAGTAPETLEAARRILAGDDAARS